MREVRMSLLVVTDDATRAELEEAIGHLRQRQLRAVIASTKVEIADEIDVLLERWAGLE
jgi:hypothetical protein